MSKPKLTTPTNLAPEVAILLAFVASRDEAPAVRRALAFAVTRTAPNWDCFCKAAATRPGLAFDETVTRENYYEILRQAAEVAGV
ncbi:MAG: hypothetical protein IT186_03900 [Acidobacteria bacterium]|nr:hypothetical protein [Acidobacteriota bacterium]